MLFIVPRTRTNWITLNIGCMATYAGCYIEKGMGLIIPGLTPDTLGETYEYYPSITELRVAAGVVAVGFRVFTLMLKGRRADRPRRVPAPTGSRPGRVAIRHQAFAIRRQRRASVSYSFQRASMSCCASVSRRAAAAGSVVFSTR
jgi:hypothetical protein